LHRQELPRGHVQPTAGPWERAASLGRMTAAPRFARRVLSASLFAPRIALHVLFALSERLQQRRCPGCAFKRERGLGNSLGFVVNRSAASRQVPGTGPFRETEKASRSSFKRRAVKTNLQAHSSKGTAAMCAPPQAPRLPGQPTLTFLSELPRRWLRMSREFRTIRASRDIMVKRPIPGRQDKEGLSVEEQAR
jgi:hypothetical protein